MNNCAFYFLMSFNRILNLEIKLRSEESYILRVSLSTLTEKVLLKGS